MDIRRSWSGLDVALVDTPPGETRALASSKHRLGFHVGRPVRAVCRLDGRTHRRLQSRGDIDLVPAGMPGIWEDDRATRILRLSVSPELLRSAAEGLGVDAERPFSASPLQPSPSTWLLSRLYACCCPISPTRRSTASCPMS